MTFSKRTTIGFSFLLLSLAIVAKLYPQKIDEVLASVDTSHDGMSQHVTLIPNSVDTGNTFRVEDPTGQEISVRLCGIEALTLDQTLGVESRNHLRSLMAQGEGKVILVATDIESNDHTVADVFIPMTTPTQEGVEEIHLNSQMIADGMAYIDPNSIEGCPNAFPMKLAEEDAQQKSLGVWNQDISQTR